MIQNDVNREWTKGKDESLEGKSACLLSEKGSNCRQRHPSSPVPRD